MKKNEEEEGKSYIEKIGSSPYWYRVRNYDTVGNLFFDIREVQGFHFRSNRIEENEEVFSVELLISLKSGNEIIYILDRLSFDYDEKNTIIISMREQVILDLRATEEYLKKALGELD